jgi:hypothetical protein
VKEKSVASNKNTVTASERREQEKYLLHLAYAHFCNMNIIDLLSDDDEDDALLMGSTQPIFAYSAPRAKIEPVTIATPMNTAGEAAGAAAAAATGVSVTAPVQDSKPHITNLGSCHFSIVGMQYAKGKVSTGDSVKLQREPANVSTVVAVGFGNVCLYRYHSLTFFRYSLCHW